MKAEFSTYLLSFDETEVCRVSARDCLWDYMENAMTSNTGENRLEDWEIPV